MNAIRDSGAKLVFSNKSVGDLATQFFADNGIFGTGRVLEDDLRRVSVQCGAPIISAISDITSAHLGTCGSFEERQVGGERFNFLTGFETLKTATVLLRGGAEQFIAESERSLHDSIMVVRRAVR